MKKEDLFDIDPDVLEEIRDILMEAIEERKWINVEEALEILNEELGYEEEESSDTNENLDE